MKIALTGHTSGIGKEFAEALKDQELKCFSRSNGYSIDTKTERDRIVREAQDCDVFISNAFSDENPWGQTELLFDLWQVWRGLNKRIILISSSNTHRWEKIMHGTRGIQYRTAKQSLENAAEQLWNESDWPLINIVAPTLMRIERTKHLKFGHQMDPKNLSDAVRRICFEQGHQTRKLIFNWWPNAEGK
jgi:nucleoside-diphosphate-sugar epimerase